MTIKFVHAADIHLDSPLRGLERYEGAPVEYVRGATRKAFVNLVDLCLDNQVDFLLIAGDLYDGDWKDYNTGLFFTSQMSRLRDAGVKVYLVRGYPWTRLSDSLDNRRSFCRLPRTYFRLL